MSTHRIQNLEQISVTPELLFPEPSHSVLARTVIQKLLASPKPQPDEWGISSFKELWIQFTPEGIEPRELPDEVDSDDFNQTWLNAISLIRPSDEFIRGYQEELQQSLRWLFESTEHFPQQEEILVRIVAS